ARVGWHRRLPVRERPHPQEGRVLRRPPAPGPRGIGVPESAARPRVHLTAPVPHEVAAALEPDFELVESPEGADGILVALTARIDDAYLERAGPQLRVVANYAVGVNNSDPPAPAARDVLVTNTPDVLTRATAELAVGLMLSLLRRITEGDRFIRRRSEWEFSLALL